ncbi:unnamed protein product [Adineta steineri]|uniref:B box-type domain-containing protein n=1 Tax=Adineta steineri TaxID=433720 RepID=A0A813PV07_9BILA|nr:unnamed protein product [Adineta steineri]CAF3764236.1 unnamed protein product [Adineta steineri]
MATANSRAKCSICNKVNATCLCSGCSKDFCFQHLTEHRQILHRQLDEIINDHDQFQQTIIQQKQNLLNSSLIQQINQWETNSIKIIQEIAEECRETVMKLTRKSISDLEKKFIELSKKLKEIREENEFNEIDLNHFQLKLTQITEELLPPSNISIRQDSQEFIKKISVISSFDEPPTTKGASSDSWKSKSRPDQPNRDEKRGLSSERWTERNSETSSTWRTVERKYSNPTRTDNERPSQQRSSESSSSGAWRPKQRSADELQENIRTGPPPSKSRGRADADSNWRSREKKSLNRWRANDSEDENERPSPDNTRRISGSGNRE